MQARSALVDLYVDYLRPRGGRAPVAALVRLLGPLGIAAPAVRTAVSRMVRQGWLHPLRLSSGPGYLLSQSGPAPGRGGRPDLPDQHRHLGRQLRPGRTRRVGTPAGPDPARG